MVPKRFPVAGKPVRFFDTTLRDGEQSPGFSLGVDDKLAMARQLAVLGVDVIEAGFAASSPGDQAAVARIAAEVRGPVICSLARAQEPDIRAAAQALAGAERRRIHVFIATSAVHMTKKLKKAPQTVLQEAREAVRLARTLCDDVEFSAEDATRSDPAFLAQVIEAVVDAGASTVNIPDTVGYATPEEFSWLLTTLYRLAPSLRDVTLSVHCHNDLGLAVANSLVALQIGADQVECTINGIGERAGNASLEEIAMALVTRYDLYGREVRLATPQLGPTSRLLERATGIAVQPNKAIVGANAFAHEAGIHQDGVLKERTTYEIMKAEDVGWVGQQLVLGKHSGRHALKKRLEQLGYALTDAEVAPVFQAFKTLADTAKIVRDEDLIEIVARQGVARQWA